MTSIDSFRTLLVDQLRELYDAEQLLVGALADLAGSATDSSLSAFLQARLMETSAHLARIEDIFAKLDIPALASPSSMVRGLVRDSERHIGGAFESGALRDAAIVGLALQFVHYGIAGYSTAIAHADVLGADEVIQGLDSMLVDELSADRALKHLAERVTTPERHRDDRSWDPDAIEGWPTSGDTASRRLH